MSIVEKEGTRRLWGKEGFALTPAIAYTRVTVALGKVIIHEHRHSLFEPSDITSSLRALLYILKTSVRIAVDAHSAIL